jgi:RNA polymerase sigma factor (sigma-70 family)
LGRNAPAPAPRVKSPATEDEAINDRVVTHLAFARAVAARSLDPRCRGADREDLIAWGVVGLVQAAQRYRGELGASFGGYAARRVRGQVLDALRERDPLTRTARRAFRAIGSPSSETEASQRPRSIPPVRRRVTRVGGRSRAR